LQIAGPGPGRYRLPPCCGFRLHDPTKLTKPAYSFGKRLENSMFGKDISPGPVYFIDSRLSRHGKDGTPSYSILGRQRDLNSFMTPSPGSYCPERCHPQGEKYAPSYSMGSRTAYRKRDCVPSPNTYSLPILIGSKIPNKKASSAYSMASRPFTGSFAEDLAKTPGPCRYNATGPDIYTAKSPRYTMLGRSYMPGDGTMKPGPGTYNPENVYLNKKQAPKISMGTRHSEFVTPLILEVTP
jgi:hypothetical protein